MLKFMTTIDRYVLQLFGKVLLVCFGSLAGLFIVVETFNNLEEFLELGQAKGGLFHVLQSYFAPRIFSLFDRTSALLTLVAAIFTLTWLQRTNELTAIMAAGISRIRVAKPLIIAAVVVSLFAVLNREAVIPHFGTDLVKTAQQWDGSKATMHSGWDHQTGIYMSGAYLVPKDQRIVQPKFDVPASVFRANEASYSFDDEVQLKAESAVYEQASDDHPAGFRFEKVSEPKNLERFSSVYREQQLIVAVPSDTPWLGKNEVFLPSTIDFYQLEVGDAMQQYQSTPSLIVQLRNPANNYGAGMRRLAHSRILQPFLDLSLFLIGLPLVVSRGDKNIFVAAGACLGVIILYFAITFTAVYLGDSSILRPYQAAFFPLLVFAPWAAWILPKLNQ
jgi:lipopolysaccharide export system permease protein